MIDKEGQATKITCELPEENAAIYLDRAGGYADDCLLVNPKNALGAWYAAIMKASRGPGAKVSRERAVTLSEMLIDAARFGTQALEKFRQHLAGWRAIEDLPQNLKPPKLEVTAKTLSRL